jgi:hypothetical protein
MAGLQEWVKMEGDNSTDFMEMPNGVVMRTCILDGGGFAAMVSTLFIPGVHLAGDGTFCSPDRDDMNEREMRPTTMRLPVNITSGEK